MSDLDATTPRVFLARHGETEWTISGQHTGTTDLPLTPLGERQVSSTGRLLVGPGKLIDPRRVQRVWVSPRRRARRTFQLLFGSLPVPPSADSEGGGEEVAGVKVEGLFGGGIGSVVVSERIREWDYGEYEGMRPDEVRESRRRMGMEKEGDPPWSVWRDGCVGGESKADIEERLDRLIGEIKELQKPYMESGGNGDIVLVAHGLILRCFVKRWLDLPVDDSLPMLLSPGSIAILSYKKHDIKQPAFYMGMALPAGE
ncbi:uncharacterized protein HMPREF1541_05119 [Cyphellophora europaea CBS 101466]|uniref:Phosphoglycerate mutase n=1 Tax=Cyphellophora europaea (strain CBS 101466) TaxID=1220924 RepID=W2RYS7_CYPE1|nr:uncharacterized protein HMPREF1541_05119 [Cyphellophora europaea CBS 101466]ETN40839.1 hypothetical protein HMPREF1541_05119 [Cyphellophora europaea CBS 101466]